MASSKKLHHNVDTQLIIGRKRRKSDLVVMWHSICDVTFMFIREIYFTMMKIVELISVWFSSSDRLQMHVWLEKYLPFAPDDFSESWRDGRLLAMLLNKLHPGCYADALELDPDYALKNMYRVFDVLEVYFGLKLNVSVEEIVTCTNGSDQKLYEILMQLKQLTDSKPEPEENIPDTEIVEDGQPSVCQSCIAKGTGLVLGFVGRATSFIIFCAIMSDLDIVIQIKGPLNTICCERITKRSPKRKVTPLPWNVPKPKLITRSVSYTESRNSVSDDNDDDEIDSKLIPLEYEIIGNQISVSYKSIEKGRHKLTILSHGQHVSDSPYMVDVEDPPEMNGNSCPVSVKSSTIYESDNENRTESNKHSVRFRETSPHYKRFGTVKRRKVLGYIVKIQGKDVPVQAESTEALAAELLKMDYDYDTWPSFHRRNSWGFTGDTDRKKSVIRQFGIDEKELELQNSSRRTRSLSIYPVKSNSLTDLTRKLNIVSEQCSEMSEKTEEELLEPNEDYYEALEDSRNDVFSPQILSSQEEKPKTLGSNPTCHITMASTKEEDEEISSFSIERYESCVENSIEDFHFGRTYSGTDYEENENKCCDSVSTDIKNVDKHTEVEAKNEAVKLLKPKKKIRKRKWKQLSTYKKGRGMKNGLIKRKKSEVKLLKVKTEKPFPSENIKESREHLRKAESNLSFSAECTTDTQSEAFINAFMPSLCEKNETYSGDLSNNILKSHNELESLTRFETDRTCDNVSRRNIQDTQLTNHIHFNKNRISQSNTIKPQSRYPGEKRELTHATSPDPEKVDNKSSKAFRLHSLKPLIQFNFKQFTPPSDNQVIVSPVKNRIVQWETCMSVDKQSSDVKKEALETGNGSVKDKLAFWENAYKNECETPPFKSSKQIDFTHKMNITEAANSCNSSETNPSDSVAATLNLHASGTALSEKKT